MFKKAISILLLSGTCIAAPEMRTFSTSTVLNKNDFFAGQFLDVRFIPNRLLAVFDRGIGTFRALNSHLYVSTSLPITESNGGFSVTLTQNVVTCLKSNDVQLALIQNEDASVYGFAKLSLDGVALALNTPYSITSFNVVEQGYYQGYYPVDISFLALVESILTGTDVVKCSGNLSVKVEFLV